MRTFAVPAPSHTSLWNRCTISRRGLAVMAIEFLTRYPASECVVTRGDWDLWGCVFDLFPKTLFHAFGGFSPDELRPNVICHGAPFSIQTALSFSKRGTQYNLIFCGEGMAVQDELYKCGTPAAALMWITEPDWRFYPAGELLYPIHSGRSSSLCALVPSHHQAWPADYSGVGAEMRAFQNVARFPGSTYDAEAEKEVLLEHARTVSGLSDPSSAALMAGTVRLDLPREGLGDLLVFPLVQQAPAQADKEVQGQLFGPVHEGPEIVSNHGESHIVDNHGEKHAACPWSAGEIESLLAHFL